MREAISKRISGIQPSGIRKFFDLAASMDDCISLGVGEPDFDTPWHVREEGIYSLEKGRTYYTANAGLATLREEISRYLKNRFNLPEKEPYANDEIIVTVGASEAIDIAFRAMLDPGDEVIIPEPCFVSYTPCVLMAGGVTKTIDLEESEGFKLTPEKLEAAITDKTKILLLAYPNNPTGAIMTEEELKRIAEVVIKHDIFVVSDEIYSELTYGRKHFSISSLPGMRERTIVINGFSKSFAMTGWRLGYAAGPQSIISQMTKIHQFLIMSSPTISQYAAIEALREGMEDVDMMVDAYDKRRKYVVSRLSELGMPCFEPEGAFYTFANIKAFGLSSEEFAKKLLTEQKVAVVPGDAFGKSGEGFLRISYAYSIEDLKIAFEKIEKFIDNFDKL